MQKIRTHFPFLKEQPQLRYFDNAATTQKPQQVIAALEEAYRSHNAPVHRGLYKRAEKMTDLYESARASTASFIGANSSEIIFTRSTTSGINFIASAWAEQQLSTGDEIIISELEHHSNFLPWQRICQRTGARLRVIPLKPDYTLNYKAYKTLLGPQTKLVAVLWTSHVLGTHINIKKIIDLAHAQNVPVLIDAAQAVGHRPISVTKFNPDFLVFSGHKMFGPTGIGVLYINKKRQAEVEPYELGGSMVKDIQDHQTTWIDAPWKFEAGSPPFIQAVGLAAAIKFIADTIDYHQLSVHYQTLASQLIVDLQTIEGIRVYGPTDESPHSNRHVISFTIDGYHPHDVAAYLDTHSIAVRAGHHCALPLVRKLGVETGTIRVSFHAYNNLEEVKHLIACLRSLPRELRLSDQFGFSEHNSTLQTV